MPGLRYFPTAEPDRFIWANNYANKIDTHGPVVGLSNDEISTTKADLAFFGWVGQIWNPAVQQYALQATAYKNLMSTGSGNVPIPPPAPTVFATSPPAVLPGILNRLFNQVQRIKLSPRYSEAIGRDLDIIASVDNGEHPVPLFTATAEQGPKGGRVRLDCAKYGHDGVCIESRVNGGPWSLFGNFTQKPIYDDRPLSLTAVPETRHYRMRWWDKDEANGEWSATQMALVGS